MKRQQEGELFQHKYSPQQNQNLQYTCELLFIQTSGLVRRNLFCFQLLGCLVALAPADTWLSVAYPPHFNFSHHFAPNHTGQPPGPPHNSPVEDCYQVNSHEADPVDEVGGGGDVDQDDCNGGGGGHGTGLRATKAGRLKLRRRRRRKWRRRDRMGAGAEKPSDSGRTNNRQQLPQKHLLARSFLTIRTPSLSKRPPPWPEG